MSKFCAFKPVGEDSTIPCPYDGKYVLIYMSESRTRNEEGDVVPEFVVGVTDKDDWIMNRGYSNPEDAIMTLMALMGLSSVNAEACEELGLEF